MKRHGGNLNAYSSMKAPIWVGYVLYDYNYMAFFQGKIMEMAKDQCVPEIGGAVEGWKGRALEIFRAEKNHNHGYM